LACSATFPGKIPLHYKFAFWGYLRVEAIHREDHILDMSNSASTFVLRDFHSDDRARLVDFLQIVPSYYPGGLKWLHDRLDDVEQRRASCIVAVDRGQLAGTLIDVEKGVRIRKISTFYVPSRFSRRRIGSALFSFCKKRWLQSGVDNVYVTVAEQRKPEIEPFLLARNFVPSFFASNRYGEGRHEIGYSSALS
jgi:hypothetical protein